MSRYWVNLGGTNLSGYVSMEIAELDNHAGDGTQYSYVTEDPSEAIKVARRAIAIYEKYGISEDDCGVHITKQPECPRCGYLGRFSDEYCSKCGTELTWKEEIDVDSLERMVEGKQ